jgi:hypothetical protein
MTASAPFQPVLHDRGLDFRNENVPEFGPDVPSRMLK